MNLQQPATLIPPVHPDVLMKPLPFYDVLDVLIKPSSLGMLYLPFPCVCSCVYTSCASDSLPVHSVVSH